MSKRASFLWGMLAGFVLALILGFIVLEVITQMVLPY